MEGATSISTILLIDVDMEIFPLYIYVQTPWVEHTKATTRKPLVWESKAVKIDFSSSFRLCYLRRLNPADRHVHHTWSLPHRPCHHPSRFARVAIIHRSPLIFIGVRATQPWMRRHDIAVDCTATTGRAQPSAWPRQLQETKTQSSSRVGTHTSSLNPNKSGLAKAN